MTSSTRKALGCVLLTLSLGVFANAQNQQVKKNSSIGGRVTIKGSGISGIVVGATGQRATVMGRRRFSSITDSQGNYRISDLPPGEYELTPAAPQFVLAGVVDGKRVIVDEGETLEGIDFTLIRGGVISGRVTGQDGQPLVEEAIHVTPLGANNQGEVLTRLYMYSNQTDDRGMYRVFGLPPGKYKISVGTGAGSIFGRRGLVSYKQTFYPSVTDAAQATVIEVAEGSVATNIDIVARLQEATYTASGRVIDGETGRPIPNVRFEITKIRENGSMGTSGPFTDARGEFRIENLTPGKYILAAEKSSEDTYAAGVDFEISDHDVADLVIKTSKGASVSGVVVFDGVDQKTARQKFGELMVMTFVQGNELILRGRNGQPVSVAPDGLFSVSGLAPGKVQFVVFAPSGNEGAKQFQVSRIERDGLAQQPPFEIKEREQITGLRLIINVRSGVLQGIVKVENGQLDPARLWVLIKRPGDNENSGNGMPLDARGRFRMTGLTPGVYELKVSGYIPGSAAQPSAKQQVVVNDDQVTEVTLTLDLKSNATPAKP